MNPELMIKLQVVEAEKAMLDAARPLRRIAAR